MDYFAYSSRPRRGLWGYLACGVAGGLVVLLLGLYVFPGFLAARIGPYLPRPVPAAPGTAPLPIAVGEAPVVQAAERALPSVVGIVTVAQVRTWPWGNVAEQRSTGSGVIIHPDGYILTNEHVVAGLGGDARLSVILEDGREVQGMLVGRDRRTDLAVVRVAVTDLPAAELGDADRLRVGELAIAIGNPAGLDFSRSVTAGVISGLDRIIRHEEAVFRLIQTDAAINQGNSGGPLVNAAGQVIGINTLKFGGDGFEGMGFAIPINHAREIAGQLIEHGRVIRPWMGITIAEAEEARLRYGVQVDKGILIVRVWEDSPADRAGLRDGDILLTLDGQPIDDYVDLRLFLDAKTVGQQLEVRYRRGTAERTVRIILEEMPEAPG
jgi:serine protease Do